MLTTQKWDAGSMAGCHLFVIEMAYDDACYKKFNMGKRLDNAPLW